jgi:hypothetical protein
VYLYSVARRLHLPTQAHCQLAAHCCSTSIPIVLHHSFIEEHYSTLPFHHIRCCATPHTYTHLLGIPATRLLPVN